MKQVGPIFKKLKKSYEKKPISFVKLDFTGKKTSKKAVSTAVQLGVNNILEINTATATIMLVDAKTKKVVDKLDLRYTEDQMRQRIDAALKQK
ncbi:MAG TPA: hypothetical protein ENI77_10635 [Nitrospirae bacterium]|nr:hypothetical protein [Nitrospirota bacterium]